MERCWSEEKAVVVAVEGDEDGCNWVDESWELLVKNEGVKGVVRWWL